jgi:zinc/manganese transport system permease protein
VGGILLAIAGTLPVSPYITTISFGIWGVCRLISWRRDRAVRGAEEADVDTAVPAAA